MITVIIPFHLDQGRIPQTVQALATAINQYPIDQVIFAHNGRHSISQHTRSLIQEAHPKFILVSTTHQGIGAGYRLGIQHAKSPWLLLSADDLPFGFSDLTGMLSAMTLSGKKKNIYFGSKLHPKSIVTRNSHLRIIFTWGFYLIRRILFGADVPRDCQGTIMLPNDLAQELLKEITDNDFIFAFKVSVLAKIKGHSIHEIPVTYIEQADAQSTVRPIKTALSIFVKMIHLKWRIVFGS